MAERRMFAKTIIDSDAFTDMPLSTQCLYFHLSMRADDDGFINNPKKIARMIGASEDDAKLLVAKKFVIPFETGVVVIKHWKIHNYIRSDRYKETNYKEEKATLLLDENNSYTQRETIGIPKVDHWETQVRLELGKDRLGKDRKDKDKVKHKHGEYKHVLLTDAELERLNNEYGEILINQCIKFLDEYIEEKKYKSNSHNLAIRRWVIDAVRKRQPTTTTINQTWEKPKEEKMSDEERQKFLEDFERRNKEEKEAEKKKAVDKLLKEYADLLEWKESGYNVESKIENVKLMYTDLTGKNIEEDVKGEKDDK